MDSLLTTGQPAATDRTSRVQRLADGRRIGYAEFGDPRGATVLALHGTPGSRLMFALTDRAARARGLRIVAPERPGYGLSDFRRTTSLAQTAEDMTAFADALGLDRLAMIGVSGGGPFAVAAGSVLILVGVAVGAGAVPRGCPAGAAGRRSRAVERWRGSLRVPVAGESPPDD